MKVFLASANAKKIVEMQRILAEHVPDVEVLGIDDVDGYVEPVEDQPTFEGNALLKARAGVAATGLPSVADDSGLCVDALDGRPGVHSARYAGPGASDRERIAKLLAELHGVPPARRTARFVCSIALADRDGRLLATFEEQCEGVVVEAPRGERGFGYDPVFVARASLVAGQPGSEPLDPSRAPTFAELAAHEKDAVSHRGKALRRLRDWLLAHPDPTAAT